MTAAYWAFTLTDGALADAGAAALQPLGYSPVQLAFLFLLYEFFGIVTNLLGGWLAARTGLRSDSRPRAGAPGCRAGAARPAESPVEHGGVGRLGDGLPGALGIAKDLTKMSAKSAVKVLVPAGDDSGLFKWVAVLTGSKNALKGAGFFVGGFLLSALGFRGALGAMAGGVLVVLVVGRELAARVDRAGEEETDVRRHPVQFVGHQSLVPGTAGVVCGPGRLVRRQRPDFPGERARLVGHSGRRLHGALGHRVWRRPEPVSRAPGESDRRPRTRSGARRILGLGLAAVTAMIPIGLHFGAPPAATMLGRIDAVRHRVRAEFVGPLLSGAGLLGSRSGLQSVGFYYMANACGRLLGTLLSGVLYQQAGVAASLWGAVVLAAAAGIGAYVPAACRRSRSLMGRRQGRRLARVRHCADHARISAHTSVTRNDSSASFPPLTGRRLWAFVRHAVASRMPTGGGGVAHVEPDARSRHASVEKESMCQETRPSSALRHASYSMDR